MSALTLWPGLVAYLLTFGFPTAVLYWVRREPGREREFLTVSVVMALFLSVISVIIGIIFMPAWLHIYPLEIIRDAQIMMLACPEMMVSVMMASMMEALGMFSLSNTTRYLPVMLTLATLIMLALTHSMTPFTAALAYTVPSTLVAFWMIWKLRSFFYFEFFDPLPAFRLLGSYGIRAYPTSVLTTLATQIDQVLVVSVLGAKDVGLYVVTLNASRVITVMHSAVVTVLFPSAAGLTKAKILAMVGRAARISTLIATLFAIALIAIYPFIIPLFYGASFDSAVRIARLLTIEAVLFGIVLVLGQAFMALERPGFMTTLQLLGLVIVLPMMLILLPRYGLFGAALALLASTIVRLILLLFSYPAVLHAPIPNLFPAPDDLRQLRQTLTRTA
jgi:O-antigen/teichoic acid export membrane protein